LAAGIEYGFLSMLEKEHRDQLATIEALRRENR
jgi:hypothetical protein